MDFRLYKFYYSSHTPISYLIIKFKPNKMKPFDVHLIIGDDKSGQHIAKVDLEFEFKP